MSSIRTNRARCALYKEKIYLLVEESISGESSGRASLYNIRRKVMFEKVSRSLNYDSIIFGPQTYLYKDTNTDHFTPLTLRMWDNNTTKKE